MTLQYRYGRIKSIISDAGSNMNPANLNPGTTDDDKEQKRLMSIIHIQTPVGGQHENSVESRISLVKQYALNMMKQVKGECYKPLSITQSDFIFASALNEINNIPLFKHPRYLYLSPQMLVNPLLQMTVDKLDDDIMGRYFDALQPYLQLIRDLRFETFIKYTIDKTYPHHDLTRQGNLHDMEGDFVMIRDERKHFWTMYGVILKLSENKTRAYVKTKKNPG